MMRGILPGLRIGVMAALFAAQSPTRADEVPRYVQTMSSKGITFLHRHDPGTPFAALSFGMRDVYAATTPGREGLVSLGGTLMLRGAGRAGQSDIVERLRDLAASATLSIGPYSTVGSVRAPTATLAPAVAMLSEALKQGQPTDRLLARLKQRIAGAESQAALRAEAIANQTALRVALGDHPITRGFDPERLERLGVEDLNSWRRHSLKRGALRIVASGRLSRSDAAWIVDDSFADLPTGAAPAAYRWPVVQIPPMTVVVEHDTPQSAVVMIGLTSVGSGRDVELANVANAVLGASSNSRLWRAVRAGLGASYGASSGFQLLGPGRRAITLRAAVANDQVGAAVEAMRNGYAVWRSKGLNEAEITAVTSRMRTEFRSSLDEPIRANNLVLTMLLANRDIEDLYAYEQRIGGLGRDTVNRFIAQRFPTLEEMLTVIVTPSSRGLGASCTIRQGEQAEVCRR